MIDGSQMGYGTLNRQQVHHPSSGSPSYCWNSPDDDLVSDLQEGLNDGDLGRDLGASDDGDEGLLGLLDSTY